MNPEKNIKVNDREATASRRKKSVVTTFEEAGEYKSNSDSSENESFDGMAQVVSEEKIPEGARVISTPEQAQELLEELKKIEDPAERKLAMEKAKADAIDQFNQIWNSLSKKRKRQLLGQKQKFSHRLKQSLQEIDNNRRAKNK